MYIKPGIGVGVGVGVGGGVGVGVLLLPLFTFYSIYSSKKGNHIHCEFNSVNFEVWEWISNFIPHFIVNVITYSIMMLMNFSDLSQSDHSIWVMWHVKDPCPLTREKWLS